MQLFTIDTEGYFSYRVRHAPAQPDRIVCYGFEYNPSEQKFLKYTHYAGETGLIRRYYDTCNRN